MKLIIFLIPALLLAQPSARPAPPRPPRPPDAVGVEASPRLSPRKSPVRPSEKKPGTLAIRPDIRIICNAGNRYACEERGMHCTPCPLILDSNGETPKTPLKKGRITMLRDAKGYPRNFYPAWRKGSAPRLCRTPTEQANSCIWRPLWGVPDAHCEDCDPRELNENLAEAYFRLFGQAMTPEEVGKIIQRITRWDIAKKRKTE